MIPIKNIDHSIACQNTKISVSSVITNTDLVKLDEASILTILDMIYMIKIVIFIQVFVPILLLTKMTLYYEIGKKIFILQIFLYAMIVVIIPVLISVLKDLLVNVIVIIIILKIIILIQY